MPDPAAQPPQAASTPPQGTPPSGSSPATQPVANAGHQAAGLAQLGQVVRLMEQLVPMLGAGSEPGKDVLKSLTMLTKHVAPGNQSKGVEDAALQRLQTQNRQQGPQAAQLRAAMASQGGGAPQPQAA